MVNNNELDNENANESSPDVVPAANGQQEGSAHLDASGEQDDILSHFQEVTGKTEIEECLKLLDESNWDLEKAVQLAFGAVSPALPPPNLLPNPLPAPPAPVVVPEASVNAVRQRNITEFNNTNRTPSLNTNTPNFIGPRLNSLSGPVINRNSSSSVAHIVYGYFWNIFYWPVKTVYSILTSVIRFALQFLFAPGPPTQRQAASEVERYISEFNSKHGTMHPRFYHGSYRESVSHAKRHLRFLMVYIHNEDNAVANRFATDVICSNLLKSIVEDNLLFWSCSSKKTEGRCVAESLNNAKPPFLALLCYKDGQMRMVYKNQGFATIETIITRLTTAIVENEPYLNRQRSARDRVSESSSSQMIMQEQDAAYQESLIRDQERARKKQEEEDTIRRIQEEQDRIEHEKKLRIQRREEFREKLKLTLKEETKADTISLLFRLPNGSRVSRKFSPHSTVKDIYEYALTCDESPNFFTLASNFPKRVLPLEGDAYLKSLVEMSIQNCTTLFVQELDSEDEESSSESEAEL